MPDWHKIRSEFPALSRWTFLNSATYGQVPARAVAAVAQHFAHRDELACTDFLSWFDDADRLREAIGRLIGAGADDIAFIQNASQAISLLMGGVDWQPGDQIVTLEDEFPNHYYYPSYLASKGVELIETPFEQFYDVLTSRTRLVAISLLNYSTGFRAPVEEMAVRLRERGILFYVDGTQGIGGLRFDAARVQPDMLAVHGYKWMLSPSGAGFLYVHPGLRARLAPTVMGWRSHQDWRRTDYLHNGAPVFKVSAEKYEGGQLVFPVLYAMAAVVDWMLEIGPEAIENRVMQLAAAVRDILRRAGGQLPFDTRPHFDSPIVTAQFEGRDAAAVVQALGRQRVVVATRRGNLRVSPHFYNLEEDLERLENGLQAAL